MAATRRLTTILAADVAGSSRLIEVDEEGTIERLKAHRRELIDPKIREFRGRIVKTTGDGLLVEFASVVDAVRCAVEVQQAMPERVYRVRATLALPDKPSIAVLPFANMSGDPEQEYFADGMVEEIITALSRIRWLFVIARNSSFTTRAKPST